jgi:hypothetical protein
VLWAVSLAGRGEPAASWCGADGEDGGHQAWAGLAGGMVVPAGWRALVRGCAIWSEEGGRSGSPKPASVWDGSTRPRGQHLRSQPFDRVVRARSGARARNPSSHDGDAAQVAGFGFRYARVARVAWCLLAACEHDLGDSAFGCDGG